MDEWMDEYGGCRGKSLRSGCAAVNLRTETSNLKTSAITLLLWYYTQDNMGSQCITQFTQALSFVLWKYPSTASAFLLHQALRTGQSEFLRISTFCKILITRRALASRADLISELVFKV